MKQKILFLFFSILLSNGIYAQGETAHWYFGRNSGIDFTNMYTTNNAIIDGTTGQTLSGVPSFVTGPLYTAEGCFSISDKEGNFLFTSNGVDVYYYDKGSSSFELMPHGSGLKGHGSAAQSGIVIPRPKHPNNYYIVTAPAIDGARTPLYYYEVDMTENNGYGDVLGPYTGTVPNGTALNLDGVYSDNAVYENIAAVGHADGINYWLLHRCQNYFFVWEVTENGISSTPSGWYAIGHNPGTDAGQGYLKFSADGSYIACANVMPETSGTASIAIAKFDNSTGVISNIKNHLQTGTYSTIFGVAFSPNNKYLYYANWWTGPLQRRTVESLINGTAESPYYVYDYVNNLQIGPDGRMYGISSNLRVTPWQDLYIVLNPDDDVPNIAVIPDYFPAGYGSHLSLPTFTSSFFSAGDIDTDPVLPACKDTEITFSIQVTAGSGTDRIVRLEWDFGDNSTIESETNMDKYTFTQKHTYSHPGTYTLTLTPYKSDGSALTSKIKTMEIPIYRCVMPVNPNIHIFK